MVEKVNDFNNHFPSNPKPASICVFPNFAETIYATRNSTDVHITVVGGCFPCSQSLIEVKVVECVKAVLSGADEVDIVLAHNSFLEGNFSKAADEIQQINRAIKDVNPNAHLKVILETGVLSQEQIANASFLAMEAGADFIKTSTGKIATSATPEAAYIMCECIAAYMEHTGRVVGFKPAGGISSAEDAALYYGIVDTVLGERWLNKELFRFGASRMANNLLSALEKKDVKYY
jgi:deoxyribose-phosphate aldolase